MAFTVFTLLRAPAPDLAVVRPPPPQPLPDHNLPLSLVLRHHTAARCDALRCICRTCGRRTAAVGRSSRAAARAREWRCPLRAAGPTTRRPPYPRRWPAARACCWTTWWRARRARAREWSAVHRSGRLATGASSRAVQSAKQVYDRPPPPPPPALALSPNPLHSPQLRATAATQAMVLRLLQSPFARDPQISGRPQGTNRPERGRRGRAASGWAGEARAPAACPKLPAQSCCLTCTGPRRHYG